MNARMGVHDREDWGGKNFGESRRSREARQGKLRNEVRMRNNNVPVGIKSERLEFVEIENMIRAMWGDLFHKG